MALFYANESRGQTISQCPFLPTIVADRWSTHGYIQQSDPIRAGQCSAQVVPWPYSADLAGIPFDQANLLGVRPFAALPTGDSSRNLLIAVPKTLPAGYTEQMSRCRGAVQIFDQRILEGSEEGGDGSYGSNQAFAGGYNTFDDFHYNSYQMRTPRGTFPIPAKRPYAIWRPKNANDIYQGAYADTTTTIWDSSGGKWMHLSGVFGVRHGGYRAAKITVRYRDTSSVLGAGGDSGNFYLKIGCDPEILSSGASPSTTLYDTSFDIMGMTSLGPSGGFYFWEKELSVPAGLVPTLGLSEYFYYLYGRDQTWTSGVFSVDARFGPRTDVPFWFPITYGNKCIRGG